MTCSLLPSAAELLGLVTVADVCEWVGLVDTAAASGILPRPARSSFLALLGNPTLIRHVAAIPLPNWDASVASWCREWHTGHVGFPVSIYLRPRG